MKSTSIKNIQVPPLEISEEKRRKIAAELSCLLADSHALYMMTHGFHWNVTGPMFNTLHLMFMDQYTEQWNALDMIAERIRALGYPAPASYAQLSKLSSVVQVDDVPKAAKMLKLLLVAQEATARTARKVCMVAENMGDHPTQDLAIQRVELHEKTSWMLRSMLED